MDNAEIKQKIESSFGPCPPYYCGVEFQPVNGIEGLGIQVSDEDGTLPTYTGKATLKVVEHDLEELIKIWREGARENGFKLDPL